VTVRTIVRRGRRRGSSARSGSPASWAAVLSLAAATAAGVPYEARSSEPEVVARVNGQPVTRTELDRMIGNPLTLRQARLELGVEQPDPGALARLALRNLIHRRLMLEEARRRDIKVTEQELDEAILSLRRRFDDLRSFGEWMKAQGLDDAALFEAVRADLAVGRVSAALGQGVRVPERDVQRYHEGHRGDFGRDEVRLQIIAVRDEAAVSEVVAALRRGEDFGLVARRRSSGLRAQQGGDTGWVAYEALGSPLRETVAIMKPRDVRGPMQNGSDFLIVRLHERRRGTKSLAEARSEIERRLVVAKQQEAVQAWLRQQEKKAKIELLPRWASAAATGAK
jgi:parvulin-like peptidyl-prolyl isomerase